MKQTLLTMCMMTLIFLRVSAQQAEIFSEKGKAINGYDPVAYFKESKPVPGNKDFIYSWKEANWYFANSENLAAFKAAPEKYAPQYGGYCAYGVAKGAKANTVPEAWTVVNGKLYLNYNKSVSNTWNKDQKAYIEKADANWPDIKDKK
ncbi:MAG: YHS domain-containing (seleno)protein [Chitinophagales bacterium]